MFSSNTYNSLSQATLILWILDYLLTWPACVNLNVYPVVWSSLSMSPMNPTFILIWNARGLDKIAKRNYVLNCWYCLLSREETKKLYSYLFIINFMPPPGAWKIKARVVRRTISMLIRHTSIRWMNLSAKHVANKKRQKLVSYICLVKGIYITWIEIQIHAEQTPAKFVFEPFTVLDSNHESPNKTLYWPPTRCSLGLDSSARRLRRPPISRPAAPAFSPPSGERLIFLSFP